MTTIKLTITGANAGAEVIGTLTSGMTGIPITIVYDEAWEGLTKNLVCRCGEWGAERGEARTILDVGDTAVVAHEVMKPGMELYLGVEGRSADGTLVIPTTWAGCGQILLGANADADPSANPTLSIWGQLRSEIRQLQNCALTAEQVSALDGMFRVCAFARDDVAAEYSAFQTAFRICDADGPDSPVVTLVRISVTYSGGDVPVGTSLTELTGILVTAEYTDGVRASVSGYTLSGEIAEGENTITVTFQGKTATFAVTGIGEAAGENNGWTDGEAYAIEWTDGYSLDTTGAEAENATLSVSGFLPCRGVSRMVTGNLKSNYQLWYYDGDKNFLRRSPVSYVVNQTNIEAYRDAYFVRTQKSLATTNASITPCLDDLLDAATVWEAGKFYRLKWTDGMTIDSSGVEAANAKAATSDLGFCYGAAALQFSNSARSIITWYDADKQFLRQDTRQNVTTAVTVPDGACYFRLTNGTIGPGCNFWVQLS